ncbi:MAG TPA: DUF3990 domain-containing protein [Gemmataceae bacterium]|jgi:hypothetical protein|nr:DUF3990 domain-containing protein [Gemmataceae bacterium]
MRWIAEVYRVALPGIPAWVDQSVLLFHGTLDVHVPDILKAVDLTRCNYLRDFGRGFYTTTNVYQAERWARAEALGTPFGPAVIQFTVSRNALASLDCLFFIRGNANAVDFWSFVQYCRTIPMDHNRAERQWYDLVAGPVTGSWRKQTIIPDGDQISFHTASGEDVLNNSGRVKVL